MPATVSLTDLRTVVRQRADIVASNYITDSELNSYLNSSICELHDKIEENYGESYFCATPVEVVTTGTTDLIPLPADFHKLLALDLMIAGSGYPSRWLTLHRVAWADRNRFSFPSTPGGYGYGSRTNLHYYVEGNQIRLMPPPTGGITLRIHYVPLTAILCDSGTITLATPAGSDYITINGTKFAGSLNGASTTADAINAANLGVTAVAETHEGPVQISVTPNNGDTTVVWSTSNAATMALSPFVPVWAGWTDGFNGWLEYVITDCVIKCKAKEESDVSVEMAQKAALVERIVRASSNRNASEPPTVSDVQGGDYVGGPGGSSYNGGW